MGYKVPWVKLWLNPRTNLPVQIHSVVADSQAMTFNDFHWNQPFDESLLSLAVPKGYKVVKTPGDKKASKTVVQSQPGAATNSTASTKNVKNPEVGRNIPVDEIAKTLDMLGQRMEANYKAIHSWSGTFDVTEHNRYTNPGNPQYEEFSHLAVDFFAEPGRGRIRINNRSIEPREIESMTHLTPADPMAESRWIITPHEVVPFSGH